MEMAMWGEEKGKWHGRKIKVYVPLSSPLTVVKHEVFKEPQPALWDTSM